MNSASNAAAAGSIVSLFGTGVAWPPGLEDAAVAPAATSLDEATNKLQMFDDYGTPLAIFYAGAAPGLIDGVFQMNVQLPPGSTDGVFTLKASANGNTLSTNVVEVYLK